MQRLSPRTTKILDIEERELTTVQIGALTVKRHCEEGAHPRRDEELGQHSVKQGTRRPLWVVGCESILGGHWPTSLDMMPPDIAKQPDRGRSNTSVACDESYRFPVAGCARF